MRDSATKMDNKLSYTCIKSLIILIAIPISDNLIPLVRSRHHHPLSNRLITATTDYYKFSFFPRAVFHWKNLPLETVACSQSGAGHSFEGEVVPVKYSSWKE